MNQDGIPNRLFHEAYQKHLRYEDCRNHPFQHSCQHIIPAFEPGRFASPSSFSGPEPLGQFLGFVTWSSPESQDEHRGIVLKILHNVD